MKIHTRNKIILASRSPRRKELLEQMGLPIEIRPSSVDESSVSEKAPAEYTEELSGLKAHDISGQNPDAWVIGADTIVVIKDRILEKPGTKEEARQMLSMLSRAEHHVYTGFTIACSSVKTSITKSVITSVEFKALTDEEIEWYIASNEPFDKAGGYGIQGLGSFLVRRINGSYSNVVGLPVCEVFETLKDLNIFELNI